MYNIKGSTKMVTKTTTRRGMTQNIENFKDFSKSRLPDSIENDPGNDPKPVFHHSKYNMNNDRHENLPPHHGEIVNFIYESWNSVFSEVEIESVGGLDDKSRQNDSTAFYYEDDPCTSLQDFKPFDLESWWGRRLYAYITNSTNTNY